MQFSQVLTLGFLLASGACAFDGGVEFLGDDVVDPTGEGGAGDGAVSDPANDPGPDLPPPVTIFFATSEHTRRGEVIDGSLLDSTVADGNAEVIVAEVHNDEERLEHKWFFDSLPAGDFDLSLIALPYSPTPATHFIVDYATAQGPGHTELFLLEATEQLVSYSGSVHLEEATMLELRVKLPNGLSVFEELDAGSYDFSDSADDAATRLISVDYLAVTTSN